MRTTASGLALLNACGYSFREDVALPPDPPSDESKRGTAFAELCDAMISGKGDTMALLKTQGEVPDSEAARLDAMWEHASRWIAKNRKLGWRAEQPFAWDPATDVGRELTRSTHRGYEGATPTELCGTADLVSIEGEVVVVWDWKTTTPGARDVDARDQLEGLALMAARAWGYDSARIVTLIVTEDGIEEVEGAMLDAFDLDAVADRIRGDLARVATSEPAPGKHCTGRYCKAIAVCPATQAALAPLVPIEALAKRYAFTPVIQSPDHAAYIVETRARIKKALEQVEKALKLYVAAEPRFTNDGREVKEEFRRMPHTSAKELEELAHRYGAPMEEIAACTRSSLQPNGIRVRKAGGKAA